MNWENWSMLAAFGVVILFVALERLGDWLDSRRDGTSPP